jgi:hypothetical protein
MIMTSIRVAIATLALTTAAAAAPMTEVKGLRANEGCVAPSTAATEKLRICALADARTRIWCPNGKVFDRDSPDTGVAVLRSICELNQLPPS